MTRFNISTFTADPTAEALISDLEEGLVRSVPLDSSGVADPGELTPLASKPSLEALLPDDFDNSISLIRDRANAQASKKDEEEELPEDASIELRKQYINREDLTFVDIEIAIENLDDNNEQGKVAFLEMVINIIINSTESNYEKERMLLCIQDGFFSCKETYDRLDYQVKSKVDEFLRSL